ncbi:unnamed protein product [Ectocarpus sp. 12 AP-2014]
MVEVGKLSRGPPSEAWARSLRQETALQDRYRRAIHSVEGGVENVGFDRWNAARCLQEQVDAARGVEHTRRLAKSRGITARFTRRSMMKDLQGTELQTTTGRRDVQTNQPGGGISDDDASLTRDQALERFGIDLSQVGVMTSSRTASRQARTPGERCDEVGNNIGVERGAAATNAGGGIGRGKEDKSVNRTGVGRGLGRNMTSPTGNNRISRKEAAVRRQEVISEKLKVLDVLLSDDIPRPPLAEEDVESKEEVAKAGAQQGESVAYEKCGADKSSIAALPIKEPPSHTKPAKIGANLREGLLPKTRKEELVAKPEPRHKPQKEGGGGGPIVDILEATTLDKARANEVDDTDQHHLCEKALPNHRPCWWWASLLPTDVEDICIPDTVFSAPARVSSRCSNTAAPEVAVAPDQTSRRQTASVSQHHGKGLLWTFSRAEVIVSDEVNSVNDTRTKSRGGLLAVEDKGSGGGTIPLSPSVEIRGRGAKIGLSTHRCSLKERPPVQHRLHTRAIDGNDGLLCAARAICECGRRGGGGGGGGGWAGGEGRVDGSDWARKGEGSKLKLPLALLKIWGYERNEEKWRKSQGGNCRGRRLTVVSLWTETEVLEALRDMARGRWCPPHIRGNANAKANCAHVDQTTPTGGDDITSRVSRRGEHPAQTFELPVGDEDACCVQAFTKSGSYSADRREHQPRGGVENLRSNDRGEHGRFKRERGPGAVIVATAEDSCSGGPVFYRAAWRKTGKKLFLWKIRSRYPYVSNVSAHFCPLVRVGSAGPFTATEVEEGVVATAATKMEKLTTVLQNVYDPTLQRLWADWAVHEDHGQWYLIEVHGVKTEADLRNAAAAKAVPPAFAEVESKVGRSTRRIPPNKHICGDPDELRARISAAGPTQELSFVEPSKKMIAVAESKRRPSRPPTPSMVAESTKKALWSRREGASERKKSVPKGGDGGARRMLNQYWRCAGDFCETHPGGQRQASADATADKKGNRDNKVETASLVVSQPSERQRGRPVRNRGLEGASEKSSAGGGGGNGDGRDGTECEEDDIVGRRKHALSVETPRTVLFRLVLNARAALLGWRPSAAEFSMMEKPVQLCSVCYMVCSTIERERIETTRRAMDAEEEAAKARRNRKPPGWKSRVQHELEESLSADRHVVSRLIDSFEAAAAIAMAAAAPNGEKIKRASPSSSSKICGSNNYQEVRNGEGRGDRGGRGESVVIWADRHSVTEIRRQEENEEDAYGESMLAKTGGVSRSAHSTPRRKTAGARRTSLGPSKSRRKTAPLAPSSGLTIPPRVQQESDEEMTPVVVGLDAKRTQNRKEEEQRQIQPSRTKLQVRARRKAKERARRQVRNKATDGAATNEPFGKQRDGKILVEDGGRAGGTPGDQKRVAPDKFPPLLQPTAPTVLLRGGAAAGEDTPAGIIEGPDGRGGEEGGEVERFGRATGSFCDDVKTSCGGVAIVNGSEIASRCSGSGEACIGYSVKQLQHLLGPTAPAVNRGHEGEQQQIEKEEENGGERARVARDCENSDYGEEDFEKDFVADEFEVSPEGKGSSSGETPGCTTEAVVGDNASSEYGEEEFEEEAG